MSWCARKGIATDEIGGEWRSGCEDSYRLTSCKNVVGNRSLYRKNFNTYQNETS